MPDDVTDYPAHARLTDPAMIAVRDQVFAAAGHACTDLTAMVAPITAAHPETTATATVVALRVAERIATNAHAIGGCGNPIVYIGRAAEITAAAIIRLHRAETRLAELEHLATTTKPAG